jgi:coenzyme F420-dependent glucose-6-phosphate dehydrogenase
LDDQRKLEESGQVVGMDTIEKMTLVVSSEDDAIKNWANMLELGFTEIVLVNSSPNRETLIKLLSQEIIPAMKVL